MAKHFVAVCVVCLLCADHLPCKEHRLDDELELSSGPNWDQIQNRKDFSEFRSLDIFGHKTRKRLKRHSHHHQMEEENPLETNENSRRYLAKIFEQFGNEKEMKMDLSGFENMLNYLGLTDMVIKKVPRPASTAGKISDQCISSVDFLTRISPSAHKLVSEQNFDRASNVSSIERHKRGTTEENLDSAKDRDLFNNSLVTNGTGSETVVPINNLNRTEDKGTNLKRLLQIDSNDLWNICPILLYQLTAPSKSGCIDPSSLSNFYDSHETTLIEGGDRKLVWLYASLSILGVSLCGLLGVAVIPCMDKKFYHQILQFLVALAVGTLTGDALLHLMPHAMIMAVQSVQSEGGDIHSAMTLKGLVAVVGVIFFFGTERALTMIAEWRKQRQKREKLPSRVRVMRDPDAQSLNNSEKLCKNKYSSYPYCYDEIAMDTKDDHHHHHQQQNHNNHEKGNPSHPTIYKQTSVLPLTSKSLCDDAMAGDHHHHNHGPHNETIPALHSNTNGSIISSGFKADRKDSVGSNNNNVNMNSDNNTMSTNLEDNSSIESSKMLKPMKHEESYTVILREHESKHHGHSHTHGHVHSPPSSLSAVAWMVVMGDGLHNFTDGMAIGAAFSNDIAGGFSTAIAVFCHELPHELGDFAVLLKAGMSARQAVYYNLLSSILSFFGMVLGIAIGDTPEASAWIFAVAAGLFIYIALVDMVPELTSSHQVRCAFSTTLLQILGMSIGLIVMFLIAINEHDLKSLFAEDRQNHQH